MGIAGSGRTLIRGLQRFVPRARAGVTVLAYHLVEGGTQSPVDLSEAQFRADLAWLARHARVVSLMDADPWGSPDQVVLTFDDAYANFADVVWPLLREYALPATLFVPVEFVDGGPAPIRDTALPACTWEQLARMAEQGLELGSHTVTHPDLRSVRDGMALRHELDDSRRLIEARTGAPCRSFCYPRALFAPAADLVVQSVYERAVVGGGVRWTPSIGAHRIPRTSLRRDMPVGAAERIVKHRIWVEEALSDAVRQRRS